ncbi:hypothetical protein [Candidatus Pantoea edessiphila]|nr:hypothetical protein [Candidatus Pantoea edessiphila]
MQSMRFYQAPMGFRNIIICNDQSYNPILNDLYKLLADKKVKVVADIPQNRDRFPVLKFDTQFEHYGSMIELIDDKTPKNCNFTLKINVNFKLPGESFHSVSVDSVSSICNYIGSFKKNYNWVTNAINRKAADDLLYRIFYIYKTKIKVRKIKLGQKIKPLIHSMRSRTKIRPRMFPAMPPYRNKVPPRMFPRIIPHRNKVLQRIVSKTFHRI